MVPQKIDMICVWKYLMMPNFPNTLGTVVFVDFLSFANRPSQQMLDSVDLGKFAATVPLSRLGRCLNRSKLCSPRSLQI